MGAPAQGSNRKTGRGPAIGDAVFGPFRLHVAQRRLEKNGAPVALGTRAFDILVALVEHAGTVVSKTDLMARVWPHATVDESALRVQIVALRKVLGEGDAGARYLTTVSGQGYCFVARVLHHDEAAPASPDPDTIAAAHNLPARPPQLVGRDHTVQDIVDQLTRGRFVTVVGPGGIGKTTVAISVAHALLPQFDGAVHFLDLGTLRAPDQVPSLIAATLGLGGQAGNPADRLVNFTRDRRLLLVLDCCEHVIETSAVIAERLYKEAAQVHVLATSRESLRVEGEHVYRLPPLASPPDGTGITAAEALAFPAVQLFVERANASSGQFELDDTDAPLVAELCRRLDGIALAIELAAGRVGAYGIKHTIDLLSDQFRLLWKGRRTAPPRHQTLRATLDWSYNLLSESERTTLRRLSVLVGNFTLDAARAVASAEDSDDARTIASVANLVAKSILTATATGPVAQYRLLDTMRGYAQEKLGASTDVDATAARHARYFLRLLESGADGERGEPAGIASQLGNISAALAWCFSAQGDRATGVALAAAAMPLFLEMSLLAQCRAWAELALDAIDGIDRDIRHELDLRAALGLARMWTGGTTESVQSCLLHALRLAEQSNDISNQLRLIDELHLLYFMAGNADNALDIARRGVATAAANDDFDALARMQVSLGVSLLLIGDIAAARSHVEAALSQQPAIESHGRGQFSLDYPDRAHVTLARILWLQGYPDQAMEMAQQAIAHAVALGHPVRLTRALLWAFAIYAWNGEADAYEDYANHIIEESGKHALGPFQAIGEAVKGVIRGAQGRIEESLILLRLALDKMGDHRYGPITDFNMHLAEGLARAGQRGSALEMIDETIARARRLNYLIELPEMLRIKAELLLCGPEPDVSLAERLLNESIAIARHQSALAWELRTSISLARLRMRQGREDEARALLAPVHDQFTEGFSSRDLRAARELLDALDRRNRERAGRRL
ncbi:ATP-binding protein [Bradyrhizobium sp. STM 3557]|uniref:ATP-binding protein n=1 Tax=Bradyrhizobium sp. STM 3557 TaxID=578920 RepID=UPI003890B5B5